MGWVLFRSEGGNRAGCLAKLPFKGSTEAHCANRSRSWFKQARNKRSHTYTQTHTEKLCGEMVLCCLVYTAYYEIVVISRICLLLYILHDGELIAT